MGPGAGGSGAGKFFLCSNLTASTQRVDCLAGEPGIKSREHAIDPYWQGDQGREKDEIVRSQCLVYVTTVGIHSCCGFHAEFGGGQISGTRALCKVALLSLHPLRRCKGRGRANLPLLWPSRHRGLTWASRPSHTGRAVARKVQSVLTMTRITSCWLPPFRALPPVSFLACPSVTPSSKFGGKRLKGRNVF